MCYFKLKLFNLSSFVLIFDLTFRTKVNPFNFSVLPSFEVKLTLETPFFYVDSEEFIVNIKATYVKIFVLMFDW